MSGRVRTLTALAAAVLLGGTELSAHTASKGLHLHVSPEPAALAGRVKVKVNAEAPIGEIRIGFVGAEPLQIKPRKPRKSLKVALTVPARCEGETINLHAEAHTIGGRTLRASAVVRLLQASTPPSGEASRPDAP